MLTSRTLRHRFAVVSMATLCWFAAARAADAQLTTDYQDLILGTSSLQNYWNFEDLGGAGSFVTVADVEGGKNGTVVGTVDSQLGVVGYAGYFAGDSDGGAFNNLVQIAGSGSDATFDLQGSFTIEALVRTDQLPADSWSGIVSKGDSAWRIARNSGNDYIQTGANGLVNITNDFVDLDNDVWHYLAMSYDSSTGTMVNVFDETSITSTVAPGSSVNMNTFDVMIGGNAEKPEREWQGLIDEVAIYDDALSVSELMQRVSILDGDAGAIDPAPSIAYWAGTQAMGSFDAAAGWAPAAPVEGASVIIGKGGEVDFDGPTISVAQFEVGSTTEIFGNDSSGEGKLNMISGELTITNGDGVIGKGTYGEVEQSGGKIVFRGSDYELGEDPSGHGKHTMTGGVLEIGSWVEDSAFDGGFAISNSGGDDLSIGRDRNGIEGQTAKGELIMSGDSIVRVADDVFLDVGIGEVTMSGSALMHVGGDLRAASADRGEGFIEMSGSAVIKVEGRYSIADSWDSVMDVTMADNSRAEVGQYLVVAGQDSRNESGVGVLTIEDSAIINVGQFFNDETQQFETFVNTGRGGTSEDHGMFVGSGNEGRGSGTVHQNGAGSIVTVGRQLTVGEEAPGVYNLRDGLLEIRGDGPIGGEFTSGGGDLIIGDLATGDGKLNIEGGELSLARDLIVGFEGVGALRVMGADAVINTSGDLSFGGDFAGAAGGAGTLDIVLTDATDHAVITVSGGTDGAPGDLLIYDGSLVADFGGGYRPALGDYSADPLEWLIIDYAGVRDGAFTLDAGLLDGSTNGVVWGVRYDDLADEVYLQVLEVLAAVNYGDFNGDGVVDAADFTVWRDNLGEDASVLMGNGAGGELVSIDDYKTWRDNFGADYNAASNGMVAPEPTAVAMLLAGLSVASIRRSRRARC